MGKWFNEKLMNKNWSLPTVKSQGIRLHKEIVKAKAERKEREKDKPRKSPLALLKEERTYKRERAEGIEAVVSQYYDEDGDLRTGESCLTLDLFRVKGSGEDIEILYGVTCWGHPTLRRYLQRDYVLEHPLGYVFYPGAPRGKYAPPEFPCDCGCGKSFESKMALLGHKGGQKSETKNKKETKWTPKAKT